MNLRQCCGRIAHILRIPLRLYGGSGERIQQYQCSTGLTNQDESMCGRLLGLGREDFPVLHPEYGAVLYGILAFPGGQRAVLGPVCLEGEAVPPIPALQVLSGQRLNGVPAVALQAFCEGLLLLDDASWEHNLNYETLLALNFGGQAAPEGSPAAGSYLIVRCKDEIQRRLYEKITTAKLAEALNVSPSYLSRVFHKEQGVTITSYVAQEKVRKAKHMLAATAYGYERIAYELGFSSQSYFGAVFKKLTDMTPQDFRTQSQNSKRHFDG